MKLGFDGAKAPAPGTNKSLGGEKLKKHNATRRAKGALLQIYNTLKKNRDYAEIHYSHDGKQI